MSGLRIGRLALVFGAFIFLVGCEEGASPFGAAKGTADAADTSLPLSAESRGTDGPAGDRDVEAPDVFQMTDTGLWDGRPSLGGVWVAHASISDPERVIIRNPANGKSVIGAAFRREQANPGPSLQISSDAAGALEILAGQPAELSIVALRREEAAEPAALPDEVVAAQEAAEDVVPADATAESAGEPAAPGTDPIAVAAAAAIDEAEGIAPAEGDETATAAAVPEVSAKGCPLFQRRKCLEERRAAAAAAAAGGVVGTVTDVAADGNAPAADPVVDEAPAVAEAPAVDETLPPAETAVLDVPVTPPKKCGLFNRKKCLAEREAAAAAAAAPADAAIAGTGPEAAIASETIPATTVAAGSLRRPYVQVGIFSVQENAQRAADQLKASGMLATVKTDQSQGKTFWRVIVGPAASTDERDALAGRVKDMGYPDAYAVSG